MVNKIVKGGLISLIGMAGIGAGIGAIAIYENTIREWIKPTAGANYAEIEMREANARQKIKELLEEKKGLDERVNSLTEKSGKLEEENQNFKKQVEDCTALKTKLAESQAEEERRKKIHEEGKVIHQIVSSPYFDFLTFPMARAEVNTDKNCLENVASVEYNHQGGWGVIDTKDELYALARKISVLYNPNGDKKGGFGKLGELCGLSQESIAEIYGEDANHLDIFADFVFRGYGKKAVSYIERAQDEKGNEQVKLVVIGPLDYIKKLVNEE